MEKLLLAGQNAADAIGLEFGIGCRHRSWANSCTTTSATGSLDENYTAARYSRSV